MDLAVLAAVIGGIATILASVLSPIISTLTSRKRETKFYSHPEGLLEKFVIRKTLPNIHPGDSTSERLRILWEQFLAEDNDDNLRCHLYKVELFINKYPNEPDALILKDTIIKAVEVKAKRRLIGPPPRHPLHMLVSRLYMHISLTVVELVRSAKGVSRRGSYLDRYSLLLLSSKYHLL